MPRLARLLASGAVATALTAALTAGGLAATTAPASAASTTATYSCTNPLLPVLPPFDVPATFTIPGLPSEVPIGVPTGDLPLTATLQLPQGLLTLLFTALGSTLSATTSNLLVPLGVGDVGVQLQGAVTNLSAGTNTLLLTLAGVLPSTTPGQTGEQSISLPTSFDLSFLNTLLATLGSHCSLKSGSGASTTIGTYKVVKGSSSVSAKTTKVKRGKKPKVKLGVTVSTPGTATLGSVAATVDGQSIGSQPLYGGVATFVLAKLSKGLHTVRFSYSGSNFANGSEQTLTVKFPKAKKHAKPAKHKPAKHHHT